MKDLTKYVCAAVALALCSACAGGSAIAPSNAAPYTGQLAAVNGRLTTAARPNLTRLPYYTTNVPDPNLHSEAKYRGTFEYVINFYVSYATVFHYPSSNKQTGTVQNVGGQGCTNVLHGYGRRTFWIVTQWNDITEYVVPHKPIATLTVPDESMPSSCAMNHAGDLAVGILDGPSSGDMLLFKNATGTGTFVKTPLTREYFDGYDPKGNLFFDGSNCSSVCFALAEIPAGSTKAQTITTSNVVQFPGSVQWDGQYLTVFDQIANKMYQYTVSGTKATLQHTIAFSGSGDCAQTWIAKGVVYCGDNFNNGGEVFNYPAGGSPIAVFVGNFNAPLGVVAAQSL